MIRTICIGLMCAAVTVQAESGFPGDIIRVPQIEFPGDLLRLLREPEILPVDEVFLFNHFPEGTSLKLLWQVRPGYYLYRNKISLMLDNREIAIQLPPGQHRVDEAFGEVQVLEGLVEGLVTAPGAAVLKAGELQLRYQGCAESGYCYPPRTRIITLEE